MACLIGSGNGTGDVLEGQLSKEGSEWVLKAARGGHVEAMFSAAVRYTAGAIVH
jgi:hypothetical protein